MASNYLFTMHHKFYQGQNSKDCHPRTLGCIYTVHMNLKELIFVELLEFI